MRLTFAASVLALSIGSAGAEEIPSKLGNALLVEWVVANCDFPESFGLSVMMANMVINGSKPDEVARVRPLVQDHANTPPDGKSDRCEEFVAKLSN